MQLAKQCFLLLILATAALFMPHAKAACTTPAIPKTFTLSSIAVSTNLPVGSAIPGTEQSLHVSGSCNDSKDTGLPIVACFLGTGSEVPGLSGVYPSGVEGVGIVLMNGSGQRISGTGGGSCNSTSTPLGYVSSDGSAAFDFNVTLELVKTSDAVTSGPLSATQAVFGVYAYQHDMIGTSGSTNRIAYSGNVTVTDVTCDVSPKSLTVPLGNIPLTTFTGTGKLSASRTVEITMTCNSTVNPQLMLTSANGYESGYAGVVKLTSESGVATGVGVRILYNGQPTSFGTYMTTSSPAYANVPLAIPFSFAYEQVSPEVTPGSANAVATITLEYK